MGLPSYWKGASVALKLVPYDVQATPLSQGFNWNRLCLVKATPSGTLLLLDFGLLIGVDDSTKKVEDYVGKFEFAPDTATTGRFAIPFKTEAAGNSPIVVVDHDGDQLVALTKNRLAKNVKKLVITFQRGVVPLAYSAASFSNIAGENGREAVSNLFILSQFYLPSGQPLVSLPRLKQICYAHPLEVDVNNADVLFNSLNRRYNAVAVYLNERMVQINEPLDNVLGYTSLLGNSPMTAMGRGQRTRVFARIYLTPEEKGMLSHLAQLKRQSPASSFAAYSYTKLVNRALLGRLLMERWDESNYLDVGGQWVRMMQETTPFSLQDLSGIDSGKHNTLYLPPPTPLFNVQWQTY